jgi:3-hydroxyisobutyrate dehydrogenase-like beta-hydroxyacid dehydrogenase
MNVGFIGLGKMGQGMARNLLRAGHRVTVFNRSRERSELLRADGADVAVSVGGASKHEIVLTMVADDKAVESIVLGDSGLLASLRPGGVHISLSTISVALADRLAAEHTRAGQHFVSAPVFGRPEAAEGGKLNTIVAGPAAAVERCQPLLAALGPKIVAVGERASLANAFKLAGNFLLACAIESLAEALELVRRSGLDVEQFLDFLTGSLFQGPVYKGYGGLIARRQHEPAGFTVPLGLKDVRFALEAAKAQQLSMPLGEVVRDRMQEAIDKGYAHMDWSAVGLLAREPGSAS